MEDYNETFEIHPENNPELAFEYIAGVFMVVEPATRTLVRFAHPWEVRELQALIDWSE